MLQVGLTGGIGSGKSTVARRLVHLGAVLVDADAVAREVVEPGTDGLAAIAAEFGAGVLGADGALDRPALAAVVFGDRAARERLNAIVHPLVRRRSAELVAAAPADAVLVQDIPLLVEGGMGARFPLVVVVHADADVRVERLVRLRGMTEADARARVAAQADDAARRAAADVWLDNGGRPADLEAAVDALWSTRLLPFEENLRRRRPGRADPQDVRPPDPGWAAAGSRLAARVAAAAADRGRGVDHVGPTAVPGAPAPDVIDLQLGVSAAADVAELADVLSDAGFPPCADRGAGQHASADPGRPARLAVRPVGSREWRAALLLRDWSRAGAPAAGVPRAVDPQTARLIDAEAWATSSGWGPAIR